MLEDIVRGQGLRTPLHDTNPSVGFSAVSHRFQIAVTGTEAGEEPFTAYADDTIRRALEENLEMLFPTRGSGMAQAIIEGTVNYCEHGYSGDYLPDAQRRIEVIVETDGKVAHAVIRANSKEWIPPSTVPPPPAGLKKRGHGHRIMVEFSDFLAYSQDGRELHLGWYPIAYEKVA